MYIVKISGTISQKPVVDCQRYL